MLLALPYMPHLCTGSAFPTRRSCMNGCSWSRLSFAHAVRTPYNKPLAISLTGASTSFPSIYSVAHGLRIHGKADAILPTFNGSLFAAGSWALVNWGFSAGDVAVLVGAGRKAGTWVFAQLKDQNLLDWMGIDIDHLLTRRGLCDTTQLHKRWDRKITLMKNGQKHTIMLNGATDLPAVEDMGRFTWLMTLFTAALDASMQKSVMHNVFSKFLEKLFEENKTGEETLRVELAQHIQGWLSAACVRSIALSARRIWTELGMQGSHQPGFIPRAELDNIVHFLLWLVAGDGNVYRTPSTDIFCLAKILERVGLNIKTSLKQDEPFDESDVVVIWANQLAPTEFVKSHPRFRPGMRIPLAHMEEVTALFPKSEERNILRNLFELGMKAVEVDGIRIYPSASENNLPRVKSSPFLESDQDLYYKVQHFSRKDLPKLVADTNRFSGWMFPAPSPEACTRLSQIVVNLCKPPEDEHNIHTLAFSLDNQEQNSRSYGLKKNHDYGDALNHLQAFFLGYWYALLLPLVDTSQLEAEEAFGSWGWSDIDCLDFIREIVHTRVHQRHKTGKLFFMYRFEIMKLVAYLFGGAELTQIRRASFGSIGIIGKIPVLYSSLVRGSPQTFGKFSLLDIDTSCIPSTDNGIVLPGDAPIPRFKPSNEMTDCAALIRTKQLKDIVIDEFLQQTRQRKDYTVHIEPDWNNDSQTCLVVYRHNGRVVTRVNPRQIDLAIARHFFDTTSDTDSPESEDDNSPPYKVPNQCDVIDISAYHAGTPIMPVEELSEIGQHVPGYVFKPIVIDLVGMTNAFVCIACLYEGWDTKRRTATVSKQKHFVAAIDKFAKVIVLTQHSSKHALRSLEN